MLKDPRGRVMTRELVIAAINKYGASHTHVGFDIVSDLLRRKCSSFFGPSDVAFYKVNSHSSHIFPYNQTNDDFLLCRVWKIYDEHSELMLSKNDIMH